MSTDVKHLRAAIALAEERNFTRAASRLRLGQSGLTKQIHSLEDDLVGPSKSPARARFSFLKRDSRCSTSNGHFTFQS